MRIPEDFIRRFGDELSNVATITVPDRRVWKMRLKICGKNVLFCRKWREFVKYYSLGYGSYLVFRYEGNSKFRVLIFDTTSAEICYPCKTGDANGEPANLENRKRSKVIDEDDVNLKARKRESDSSHGKKVKSGCSENDSSSEIAAKDVAGNRYGFKPKNPSFTSTIRSTNLYVPSKFAGKFLKQNVWLKKIKF